MRRREEVLAVLGLFASTSTLLCCALPTLLVTLGLGVVVAGAVSAVPLLASLSRHKGWVFLVAGLLLAVEAWLLWRGRRVACEEVAGGREPGRDDRGPAAGGGEAAACGLATRFGRRMWWVSAVLYAVGFVVAYVAFPLGRALGLL